MMKRSRTLLAGAVLIVSFGGCATSSSAPPTEQETLAVIRAGFRDRGIATVDRLNQTELQATCSKYHNNPPQDVRAHLEKAALATVKYPGDGKWLGDFKQGERIAQTGVGLQWTDTAATVNGGNCYACHRLSKEEIAFGNIGPSLYHYGKTRGTSDETLRYTWGKIWNTHAYKACSQMPRFGDAGILTEGQIKDVMALLLDPNSPVNK
ncbi:MAG TPA: sulfur oxidation c-type cytochrome SoxX [Burkholderiaceae bacterium]|nr:sulfur oxidation c-type cytochrome SoxX [Burkholderiaceae bacterium]